MTTNNDRMTELMLQIQKGDYSVYGELRKMCEKKLNLIIKTKGYTFTPDFGSEDYINQTIVDAVFVYKDRFDANKASFPTWLNKIAATKYYKRYNKRVHKMKNGERAQIIPLESKMEDGEEVCTVDMYLAAPSAEDIALSNIACEDLLSEAAIPSVKQRDAIIYRKVAGLSSAETARIMGCKPENVDLQVYRGKKSISDHLSREESYERSDLDSERCVEDSAEERDL